MASAQTLLYAAASDVTMARVRALIQQVGPESPTVEYKEKLAEGVARGIAALANTYGGIMLIGVTNDREIVGVKASVIDSVAEHCFSKIEPPYVPEVVPVPMDDGSERFVLVLRVVPGHYRRPLLTGGAAYVRDHSTTHPADWQRLSDLFTEGPAASDEGTWNISRPDVPRTTDTGLPDQGVDLVLRSGLKIAISREAKWRPLSERTVATLAKALDASPFSAELTKIGIQGNAGGINHYKRAGFNRSREVRLEWSASPGGLPAETPLPAKAHASLSVPGAYGDASTHLTFHLDGYVQRTATAEHLFARTNTPDTLLPSQVSIRELRDLVDTQIATLTSESVVAPIAELAGVDVAAVPQPKVLHLVTARPVTDVLSPRGLHAIANAGVSHGAHLASDPALDLADTVDRGAQVRMWLVQAALDSGLLGMEQLLEQIDADTA